MKKINLFVKLSSWIFILTGIVEFAGIVVFMMMGGTRLSDFFDMLFIESVQAEILFIIVIIIRAIMGVFGLLGIRFDVCMCLAFFLTIKDFVFMYYFYNTNIYMFLYRGIPELLLVILYMLGTIHSKYEET